jgi:hypothetical protein
MVLSMKGKASIIIHSFSTAAAVWSATTAFIPVGEIWEKNYQRFLELLQMPLWLRVRYFVTHYFTESVQGQLLVGSHNKLGSTCGQQSIRMQMLHGNVVERAAGLLEFRNKLALRRSSRMFKPAVRLSLASCSLLRKRLLRFARNTSLRSVVYEVNYR